MCRRPSSPSRIGASTSITASIRIGIARAFVANVLHRGVCAGRLDDHPAARQKSLSDAGAHDHSASCRKCCWRCGWSANSPRRRSSRCISTASISAPAPTASSRRRSAISASPPQHMTPAEAALLAGLVKSPSRLAPTRDFDGRRKARPGRARGHGASCTFITARSEARRAGASAAHRRAGQQRLRSITSPTG